MCEWWRMKFINDVFDNLWNFILLNFNVDWRLFKVDILRLVICYIGYLFNLVEIIIDFFFEVVMKKNSRVYEKIIVCCYFFGKFYYIEG